MKWTPPQWGQTKALKRIADFITYSAALEKRFGIRIRSFGHAGDGNLHIYILRDQLTQSQWENKLQSVFDALYDKAVEMGGKVSGEHGIGYVKRPFLKESLGEDQLLLMASVKHAFDPKGILNPGKVF